MSRIKAKQTASDNSFDCEIFKSLAESIKVICYKLYSEKIETDLEALLNSIIL